MQTQAYRPRESAATNREASLALHWVFHDGGRSEYFKGIAGDCSARAMSIALGIDYKICYDELALQNKHETGTKSVRSGISKKGFETVLNRHGWHWKKAPAFEGRKAKCSDLCGIVIARQSRHFVAVIDGVAYDTFDSSGKMVYGYWAKTNKESSSNSAEQAKSLLRKQNRILA